MVHEIVAYKGEGSMFEIGNTTHQIQRVQNEFTGQGARLV